jgi:hypothetical protein
MPYINNRAYGTAIDARAVTASDTTDLPDGPCRAIYIGGTGNVSLITGGGSLVTFSSLNSGYVLPLEVVRVRATGTTATNIIALY